MAAFAPQDVLGRAPGSWVRWLNACGCSGSRSRLPDGSESRGDHWCFAHEPVRPQSQEQQ